MWRSDFVLLIRVQFKNLFSLSKNQMFQNILLKDALSSTIVLRRGVWETKFKKIINYKWHISLFKITTQNQTSKFQMPKHPVESPQPGQGEPSIPQWCWLALNCHTKNDEMELAFYCPLSVNVMNWLCLLM